MPSAANRQGNVMEFHIVWRVVTLLIYSVECVLLIGGFVCPILYGHPMLLVILTKQNHASDGSLSVLKVYMVWTIYSD